MAYERMVTAFGETKNISDWQRDGRCWVTYKTLYARLVTLDWLPEAAISTPHLRLSGRYRAMASPVGRSTIDRLRAVVTSDVDLGF